MFYKSCPHWCTIDLKTEKVSPATPEYGVIRRHCPMSDVWGNLTQVVATSNYCSVNCMWMQWYSVGEILSVYLSWISSLVGLVTVALIFLDMLTCCHCSWLWSWEGRHVTNVKWDWGSAEKQWSWPRTVRTAKHSCFNEKVHCVRLKTLVNQVHFYM